MPKLLVLAWPGCTWAEVAPTVTMLADRAPLVLLGPSAAPIRTSEGLRLLPDGSFTDLDPSDAALVVVPGGDIDGALTDPTLRPALQAAAAVAPVGGICNGALLLAAAGLLRGRRCTHTAHPRYAPRPAFDALLDAAGPLLQGSSYVDEDVVVDGGVTDRGVVTARPWAALRFAATLARLSGLRSREEAAAAARYQAGWRDRPGEDPYRLWAIELRPTGAPTSRAEVQAHVLHLHALERRGLLVLAGPYGDGSGGLVVVRAQDLAHAQALAAADPFVARGLRQAQVRAWERSCQDNLHLGVLEDADAPPAAIGPGTPPESP